MKISAKTLGSRKDRQKTINAIPEAFTEVPIEIRVLGYDAVAIRKQLGTYLPIKMASYPRTPECS